jgi:Ni,Fe-hydrogenase I small subunit
VVSIAALEQPQRQSGVIEMVRVVEVVEVIEISFCPAARIKFINCLAAYRVLYARFRPMELFSTKNRPMGFLCPNIYKSEFKYKIIYIGKNKYKSLRK